MKKVIALTTALVFATTATAAACYQPPEPLTASITICGDPRAVIDLDGEGTVRIVFWSGGTGERRVIRKDVDGPRTLKRWVKGAGRKVSVYDDATNAVLARVTVTRAEAPCK